MQILQIGGAVEWLEVEAEAEADAARENMGDAAPVVPFSLDWTAQVRAKAVASASHLCAPQHLLVSTSPSPTPLD